MKQLKQPKQRFSCAGSLTRTAAFALTGALAIFACTQAPASDDPYTGEIQMFAGDFCPKGWVPADGRLLSIAEYQALYALYGTNFGGDGRTTVGIPDLRGRVPRGAGDTVYAGRLYVGSKSYGGTAKADPDYPVTAGSVNAVGVVNFCVNLEWGQYPPRS